MQMLDRYLHAIAFWLPAEQRQDIIAELSEDLNAQIEEQQIALRRNLTETELEALLKRRGRPVLVANQYRPQQSLIGPVWFPAYTFVLKIVGLGYVLPWLVVFVVLYRVQHRALHWGTTLLAAWESIWTVALVAVGVVTLIFTILERVQTQTHFLEMWSPRHLPQVRDPYHIPLFTSITDLVANLVFLFWWTAYAGSPLLVVGSTFRLTLAPVRVYFFWGYVALALFNIALAGANLRTRSWSGLRATFRLLLDFTGGVLFCWLLKSDIVANLSIANLDPARTLVLKNALHLVMERCFPVAVIVLVVIVAFDLGRLVRVNRKDRFALTGRVLA